MGQFETNPQPVERDMICQDPAGNWTTRRSGDREETQTAVVWKCLPFIRSGQNHLASHIERRRKTRQTEEEVGRQHQRMDRPGVRQVPESIGEQRKMEETCCEIICGAPVTFRWGGSEKEPLILSLESFQLLSYFHELLTKDYPSSWNTLAWFFSSVQSLDQLVRWGDMRDDSADIPFQSFLQEAPVSSSGKGRDVHSLMLSLQHFFCRPGISHPPWCPQGWFWRGSHGVWLTRSLIFRVVLNSGFYCTNLIWSENWSDQIHIL